MPLAASRTEYPSSSRASDSASRIPSSSSMNSSDSNTGSSVRDPVRSAPLWPTAGAGYRDPCGNVTSRTTALRGQVAHSLLPKSHNSAVALSQTGRTMAIVHAAPVRYLPPPGASPAACEPSVRSSPPGQPSGSMRIRGALVSCHTVARGDASNSPSAHPRHAVLRLHRAARRRRAHRRDLRVHPQQPDQRAQDVGTEPGAWSTPTT